MDASGRKKFPSRFVSAEGCYSYEALQAKLKLKIALKQAVGLETSSHQQAFPCPLREACCVTLSLCHSVTAFLC